MDVNWDEREISAAMRLSSGCLFVFRDRIEHAQIVPACVSVKSDVSQRCPRALYNSADVDELPRRGSDQPDLATVSTESARFADEQLGRPDAFLRLQTSAAFISASLSLSFPADQFRASRGNIETTRRLDRFRSGVTLGLLALFEHE